MRLMIIIIKLDVSTPAWVENNISKNFESKFDIYCRLRGKIQYKKHWKFY